MTTEVFENYKRQLRELSESLKEIEDNLDRTIKYEYGINAIYREYASQLGFNIKQIEAHLLLLNEPPSLDVKTSYSLREILEEENSDSSWLVPKLYRKSGLYILGAAPKSFKSMSMYDLAYAVSTGGLYLDAIPCAKGKVLYYQCEEARPTIKNRLVGRGFGDDLTAMENDMLRFERSFNIKNDISVLEQILTEFNPVLTIFDSLRGISSQLDVSENSVEFSKYIYALQRLFIMHDKTAILIHHKNKTPGAKGLSSLSGSLSIGGASDGVILMNPDPNEIGRVRLETIPRDGTPVAFMLKRQMLEGGRWKFILEQELNVDPAMVQMERRILRVLANQSPTSVNKSQLSTLLGCSITDHNLTYALDRLLEADIVSCKMLTNPTGNRVFEFFLPQDNPWTSQKDEINIIIKKDPETVKTGHFIDMYSELANTISRYSSKLDIKTLTKDWTPELKQEVWNLLIPTERERIESILSSNLFDKGDIVKDSSGELYEIEDVSKDEIKNIWVYKVDNKILFENELTKVD